MTKAYNSRLIPTQKEGKYHLLRDGRSISRETVTFQSRENGIGSDVSFSILDDGAFFRYMLAPLVILSW